MKKHLLLLLIITMFSTQGIAYVLNCPGTTYYSTSQTITFSDCVNSSYFEVGPNYFWLSSMNFTVESLSGSSISYNLSFFNDTLDNYTSSSLPYRFLEFNASYARSGSYDFQIKMDDYYIIDMFVDGSIVCNDVSFSGGLYSFAHSFPGSSEKYTFYIDGYTIGCPQNASSEYDPNGGTVNLTWDGAARADNYVVVRRNDTYPSTYNDPNGYEVQNSSLTYYNTTLSTNAFFSVWSYNNSGSYSPDSCKLDLPWGAIRINVYNESNPSMVISPFGLLISNSSGTVTYQDSTVTGPITIDLNDIPYGSNTILKINATNYKDRTYYKNLVVNNFYNYTFYLPPIETEVDKGGGDTGGSGENFSTTQNYVVQVIDELNNPVENANVDVRFYNNFTDSWNEVASLLTDGYGQADVWLIPGTLYKFNISADGYESLIGQDWTPKYIEFTEDRYKTFRLEFSEPSPPDVVETDIITWNAQRLGNNIYVNWSTSNNNAINTTIKIYEVNITYKTTTLYHTNTTTDQNQVNLMLTGVNSSNDYIVYLWYNTSDYKNRMLTKILNRDYGKPQDEAPGQLRLPDFLTTLVGHNPFGWGNFLIFVLLILGMFYIDQKDSGLFIVLLGGLFLFINIFLGFTTTLATIAGGIIPALFIIVGIIIMWNQHKWRDTSG